VGMFYTLQAFHITTLWRCATKNHKVLVLWKQLAEGTLLCHSNESKAFTAKFASLYLSNHECCVATIFHSQSKHNWQQKTPTIKFVSAMVQNLEGLKSLDPFHVYRNSGSFLVKL
jgi:hypothetical protein